MQIRTPAVAGMFYPAEKKELEKSIHNCFMSSFGPQNIPPTDNKKKIYGVICPHAGYEYSGPTACKSYYAISSKEFALYVLIGPNHWSLGSNVATIKESEWETPLGNVQIDSQTAIELEKNFDLLEFDFFSHIKEHSIEVQIPMLQKTQTHEFKILPILLADQSKETSISLGKAIAKVAHKKDLMVIGSSDFTHYEPNEFAHQQDEALIEQIIKLDVEKFYEVLEEKQITSCGYGAIATTMTYSKEMGATKGELLGYATSGDITGDKNSVVGYGSLIFT